MEENSEILYLYWGPVDDDDHIVYDSEGTEGKPIICKE